ncbi:MAG: transporter substrate-binding protein [Frankiales bacterium]|nr:transporter substrate-binding protein [Frankiales bacterium]
MTIRRTTTKLLPAALALVLAAACGGSSTGGSTTPKTTAAKVGGTITYGADQEPTGFNPLTSKDSGTSVVNVIEGVLPSVFKTHPDFTVQLDKDVMVSAELTNSNPETVVYKIRPEAKWSDGVPVDVADFELQWKAQNGTDKKFDVAGTTGYEDIGSVTGSDGGKTVTVVFKKVFADWRALFGQMVPAHLANKMAGGIEEAWNNGFNNTIPVSAGPFKFGAYKKTESLTLVRNDQYFGTKANLDSIIFRFLPESTTQPDALKNGEVQVIYPQPQLDLVAQVKAIPGVVSETNFGLTFEHLDFNVKTPGLNDVVVRKAIALGLDTDSLLKRTVGQFSDKAQTLGNRIYVNSQKEYVDNGGANGKGDVTGAAKLLTDAGYAKGADGIFAKGGKKLSFRFSTTSGNKLRETQGELFKAQMKLVGIDIRIDNSTSTVLFGERLPAHNFDIADFAWVATPFATSNTGIYTTGGGQNYGQYSSAVVDSALKAADSTLDDTDRTAKFNAIDKQIWDDMATIPLYQKPTFIAYSDKYVNIGDNASSEGPFWNVGTWGLKK